MQTVLMIPIYTISRKTFNLCKERDDQERVGHQSSVLLYAFAQTDTNDKIKTHTKESEPEMTRV